MDTAIETMLTRCLVVFSPQQINNSEARELHTRTAVKVGLAEGFAPPQKKMNLLFQVEY